MGKETGIPWTDKTMSPWWGCVEVSEECTHCYAREFDARFGGSNWGKDGPRRLFGEKHWREPLAWNRAAERGAVGKDGRRTFVFCSSMADVFESRDDLDGERGKLWDLIRATKALTWLLLTKRPQSIARMLPTDLNGADHVWLGTTCGLPASGWRVDALVNNSRAPVNFISMEPMLEETNLDLAGIQWIIQGTESGDGARPAQSDWFRRTRDECAKHGVAYFNKQMDQGMDGVSDAVRDGMTHPPYRRRDLRSGPDGMKRVKWIVERPLLDNVQSVEWPA